MSNETPTRTEIRLRNEGERDALTRIRALIEDGATLEQLKAIVEDTLETMDRCEAIYDRFFKDAETL